MTAFSRLAPPSSPLDKTHVPQKQVRHLDEALRLVRAGRRVIPIGRKTDSKAPRYDKDLIPNGVTNATTDQTLIRAWWNKWPDAGIGVAMGGESGDEGIDIDNKGFPDAEWLWDAFSQQVETRALGLIARLYIERTQSGGFHITYRCPGAVENNQALARRPATEEELQKEPKEKFKVLIETRGEGGYFVVAPSSGYTVLQGDLADLAEITPEERAILFSAARSFNVYSDARVVVRNGQTRAKDKQQWSGMRAGDDYNANAQDEALRLLEGAGWIIARTNGNVIYLTRPGKDPRDGISASFGHVEYEGIPCFWPFTTASGDFKTETAYTPFAVYTILEHSGDYSAAAKVLGERGFGDKPEQQDAPETRDEPVHDAISALLVRHVGLFQEVDHLLAGGEPHRNIIDGMPLADNQPRILEVLSKAYDDGGTDEVRVEWNAGYLNYDHPDLAIKWYVYKDGVLDGMRVKKIHSGWFSYNDICATFAQAHDGEDAWARATALFGISKKFNEAERNHLRSLLLAAGMSKARADTWFKETVSGGVLIDPTGKATKTKKAATSNDDTASGSDDTAESSGQGVAETIQSISEPVWFKHPETNEPLYIPFPYTYEAGFVYALDRRRQRFELYAGIIYVLRTGSDLATGDGVVEIGWGTVEQPLVGTRIVLRERLADSRRLVRELAARGCLVTDKHASEIAAFLNAFLIRNRDAIPHEMTSERLGLLNDDLLVLPAGCVSSASMHTVRYIGPPIAIGTETEAYPQAIREAATWGRVPTFWLVLALSVASPLLARWSGLRRNPVVYLSGQSGYGKTTLVQFATGVFGNPELKPLLTQAFKTTAKGFLQNLQELNSLPSLIDEAHTADDPKAFEDLVYAFANGQAHTIGGKEGLSKGGKQIHGTQFLCGEDTIKFRFSGSQRRLFWIGGEAWEPLGAAAGSPIGKSRAAVLERAWNVGAGLFAPQVLTPIWSNWPEFTATVEKISDDPLLAAIDPAWQTILAVALATVRHIIRAAAVTLPDAEAFEQALLADWCAMFLAGQIANDSAVIAWTKLVDMLNEAQVAQDGNWTIKSFRGSRIAFYQEGDDHWRVLINATVISDRLGENVAKIHGKAWNEAKMITPGANNQTTRTCKIAGGDTQRAIFIPVKLLGVPSGEHTLLHDKARR